MSRDLECWRQDWLLMVNKGQYILLRLYAQWSRFMTRGDGLIMIASLTCLSLWVFSLSTTFAPAMTMVRLSDMICHCAFVKISFKWGSLSTWATSSGLCLLLETSPVVSIPWRHKVKVTVWWRFSMNIETATVSNNFFLDKVERKCWNNVMNLSSEEY